MDLPGTDRITNLLATFLDVQSRRAQITSANIANADTPGYAAKELDFDGFLKRAAIESLDPSSMGSSTASASTLKVVEQSATSIGLDGNTVDLSREMTTLAETGMQYLTGTQLLQSRLRALRSAIREGR